MRGRAAKKKTLKDSNRRALFFKRLFFFFNSKMARRKYVAHAILTNRLVLQAEKDAREVTAASVKGSVDSK